MCCGRLEPDGGEDEADDAPKKKGAKAPKVAKAPTCDCGVRIGRHRKLKRLGLQGH